MRISRAQAFMETAWIWSKRATCFRMGVGAIVVVQNRIVSCGYNGQAPGEPHCPGNACPGAIPGNCNTIHAERNALDHVPQSMQTWNKTLYCTHAPCYDCAEYMIENNVLECFYAIPYRLTSGVDALLGAGAKVYRVTPAGHVVNHHTNEVVEMP